MYKLHVCRYTTSVYPLLRYSLCFFGLFSLHHWFTIHSTPETKNVKKAIYTSIYLYVCMYVCMYVCKTCKFRRQAFQDIVVPIQRAPRCWWDVTIHRLLDIASTKCRALPGETSFRTCISNLIKIPLNV